MTDDGNRIRDEYFALRRGPNQREQDPALQRLLVEIAAITAAATTHVHGLALCHSPTARFHHLRFLDAAELDERTRARFARPCPELPHLAAAFVDPEEFDYRTFENIVGLDRLFTGIGSNSVHFGPLHDHADGVVTAHFSSSHQLAARLAQLDELGLHVRPHAASRGGQRFIFHSADLADALTAAVREALPAPQLRGFVHVNPVFRCNRFDPGDAPFTAHHDSPYFHRARHHVSKYTLLLYLTAGRGEALRFADRPPLRDIEADTAVLFAQSLAHEGHPYADTRKLFLRTELIFEDVTVQHAPAIAELFARACYLGTGSVFTPALAEAAHTAHDRAAAAHWRTPAPDAPAEPWLHKQFRGAHFVTNGHDYFFDTRALGKLECAALVLLDLLNARIDGAPFRKLCTTTVLTRDTRNRAWICPFLESQQTPPEPVFAGIDKHALMPEPEQPQPHMGFPSSRDFDPDPFPDDWDAPRHPRIVSVYSQARRWTLRQLLAAPITMLGKELFLDPDRFVVVGDKIHILSHEALGPVHFAGAVFFDPADFIAVDVTVGALQPLVPPMSFHLDGHTLHLCCDLFRNSWLVSHRIDRLPIPRISQGLDVQADQAPWLLAAGLDSERLRAATED